MRQFTKLVENLESNKFYKIETTLDLVLKAESPQAAGMLAEQILKNVNNHFDYNTKQIQEVTKDEYNHLIITEKVSLTGDKILNSWTKTFGDREPSLLEKMEFYHLMRSRGFESNTIDSALDGKI
jgi:hypothetical protein